MLRRADEKWEEVFLTPHHPYIRVLATLVHFLGRMVQIHWGT
jgi:hypothetical protein